MVQPTVGYYKLVINLESVQIWDQFFSHYDHKPLSIVMVLIGITKCSMKFSNRKQTYRMTMFK